jgi:hypothetical protein
MSDDTAKPVDAASEPPPGTAATAPDDHGADAGAADEPKTSVQGEPEALHEAPAAAGETPARRPNDEESPDEERVALDANGRERPRFLLAFPEDPALARLAAAFEAGNYALVRTEAEALAERTENPAVRDAALELRRRIDPDPLAKYLLALTLALLLSLAYFAYHH